jgi:hypothetical protein
VFAFGLPFPQETDTETPVREFIRTLLGPKPHLITNLGPARTAAAHDLDLQKSALIAYRAKLVALIDMLESGVKLRGNKPISRAPQSRTCVVRKPITAARLVSSRKKTAA